MVRRVALVIAQNSGPSLVDEVSQTFVRLHSGVLVGFEVTISFVLDNGVHSLVHAVVSCIPIFD